ncbi:hypothetical protein FOZ63_032358 [Perkinsus olseni]|uniref:Uncharacterized protein n=1 Tax=Perkinsus olseni TaxID=32597 RepID=A0A7J6TUY3_PEROL|nr:hypothetical protein FOZ63_032358 [Perkinsus olseni]
MSLAVNHAGKRAIWTTEEVQLLGSLVADGDQKRREVIMSKNISGDFRRKKKEAWEAVAQEFNTRAAALDSGYSGCVRTAEQVKQRWTKGKSQAKNQNAVVKASLSATGGGKAGVEAHLQDYLTGLSPEELRGCTNEDYGSINLNAAVAVAAVLDDQQPNGGDEVHEVSNAASELNTNNLNDEKSATPTPSSVSPMIAKSTQGEFSLKRISSTPREKPPGKKSRSSSRPEDALIEEELKTTRLWRRVLKLKLKLYEKTLAELGLDDEGLHTRQDDDLVNTYNFCHSSTRFVCERAFGVLKSRWRCVHSGLRVEPQQAVRIVAAAVTLHNMCRRKGWRSFRADDYIDPEVMRAIHEENGEGEDLGIRDIVERGVLRDDPVLMQNGNTAAGFRQIARMRRQRLGNWLAFVRQAGMGAR